MHFCGGNNGITIIQGEFTIITMATSVTGKAIANSAINFSNGSKVASTMIAPTTDLEHLVENYKSTAGEHKWDMGTERALL